VAPYEYLLPLVSVLVGLALADLLTSVHRLLRARPRVRWDALPLLAALIAAFSVLDLWWGFYGLLSLHSITYGRFALLALPIVVLFLLSAAALPDRVPDVGLDLHVFYRENAAYFWTLFGVYIVSVLGLRASFFPFQEVGVWPFVAGALGNLVILAVCAVLVGVRHRGLHAVGILFVLAISLVGWLGRELVV